MTLRRLLTSIAILAAAFSAIWIATGFGAQPAFTPSQTPAVIEPGRHTLVVAAGGGETSVDIWIPSRFGSAPASAVVVLHGAGGSAESVTSYGTLLADAERSGIVVIAPSAATRRLFGVEAPTWDAGDCCGPGSGDASDVEVVVEAVNAAASQLGLSWSKLKVAGHSNGAMLALGIGCNVEGVDAVVVVAGSVTTDCEGSGEPPDLVVTHSRQDDVVPFIAGQAGVFGQAFSGVAAVFTAWNDAYLCTPRRAIDGLAAGDGVVEVAACPGGGSVSMVVYDGGHRWPEQATRLIIETAHQR